MIASLLASKTAKIVATCVCPVAGAAGVTMAVPQVRHAVHNMTAPPRAYAKPKSRVREVVAPPCADGVMPLANAPDIASLPASPVTFSPLESIRPVGGGTPPTTNAPNPLIPVDYGPGPRPGTDTPPGTDIPPPITAVPETASWVQLIVGFGLVGGAARMAVAKHRNVGEV